MSDDLAQRHTTGLENRLKKTIKQVFGVDFSGANKAGKKIWISGGDLHEGSLVINECRSAAELPGGAADRAAALCALRVFIASHPQTAFGLDFPFGLAQCLVGSSSWKGFLTGFGESYPSAEEFRKITHSLAGGKEPKRQTDKERKTPFAANNIRLFEQTYFGIRDLLTPLVKARQAAVLPMEEPRGDVPWLMEVCPASTLKAMKLYDKPYKRRGSDEKIARAEILGAIEAHSLLKAEEQVRERIAADFEGDALDSVVAAFAVMRVLSGPAALSLAPPPPYTIEGYVYA